MPESGDVPLPTGDVTFLFTDIEGSTRLAEALREGWVGVLDRHHAIIRGTAGRNDGTVVSTEGDAFFIVFRSAADGVRCAVEAQRALATETWPEPARVRVRMGIHTGEATLGGDNYVGLDVHRAARVAAAAHGGQVIVSDATRALASPRLEGEVGFIDLGTHRLRDLSGDEHLYQVEADGLERTFPPPRALSRSNNLPLQLTSFIGRETEVAAVSRILEDGARLVTLTGPGGTGKTRLSLQITGQVADRFPDGVTFVDLSMVTEPDVVAIAIARALGVVDRPGRTPREAVVDHLRDRTALLILDNFEQVVAAAALVAEIARAAPALSIVATSRGALRISGEREYRVPPLDLPDPSDRPTAELVARSASGALFTERANAARPDFRLNDDNAPAVAAICARLDGLPLAIELAAARVRLLPPDAILARLGSSLDLLAGGGRDLPARQQTLRGAIAWSYDLLSEPSRRLFARLSVFAGGAAIDEIETVCRGEGEGEAQFETDLLEALDDLVDQSLVRGVDAHGDLRFTMLGTVRAYAAEILQAAGETDELRRRHAVAYAAFAERAAPELLGVERRAWLDRFAHEHDNIGAAMDWAKGAGASDVALRLAAATWRYWQMRGHLIEGRDRIGAALSLPDVEAHPAVLARALGAAGGIAYWLGDHKANSRFYERALAVARSLEDPRILAEALTDASLSGDGDLGDPELLSRIAARGLTMLDEALSLYRSLGDRRGEAAVLWTIGTGYTYMGRLDEGRTYLGRSAELSRASGDLFHESWATFMLASIAFQSGRADESAPMLRDALRMFTSVRDVTGMMLSLDELAKQAASTGHREFALRLAGAVDSFERQHGTEYTSTVRRLSAAPEPAEAIRADPVLAAAWAEGQDLDLDEAVELALA